MLKLYICCKSNTLARFDLPGLCSFMTMVGFLSLFYNPRQFLSLQHLEAFEQQTTK